MAQTEEERLAGKRESARKWRKKNPGTDSAKSKAYRLAHLEERRAYERAYYHCNKEKVKAAHAAYVAKNRQSVLDKKRAWAVNSEIELRPSFVAHQLGLRVADCPPELLEAKRLQLTLHRLTKKIKQAIKDQENETL